MSSDAYIKLCNYSYSSICFLYLDYKVLAHAAMEAEKFPGLSSTSWRLRRASGVVWRPESLRGWWHRFQWGSEGWRMLGAGGEGCSSLHDQAERVNPIFRSLHTLYDAHSPWEGHLPSIQVPVSSENPSQTHPEIMLSKITGIPWPSQGVTLQLTITGVRVTFARIGSWKSACRVLRVALRNWCGSAPHVFFSSITFRKRIDASIYFFLCMAAPNGIWMLPG